MIWLAFSLAIVSALAVGLYTHNWKRAFIVGLIILGFGIVAAFAIAYVEWWIINNS